MGCNTTQERFDYKIEMTSINSLPREGNIKRNSDEAIHAPFSCFDVMKRRRARRPAAFDASVNQAAFPPLLKHRDDCDWRAEQEGGDGMTLSLIHKQICAPL